MQEVGGRRSVVEVRDGLGLSVIEHAPAGHMPVDDAPETFVLVHGLASNACVWDGVGGALARAGHRAWAVDLRGHGRSSKPDDGYDMTTMADDVCRLIAGLAAGRVVLAGQSWGGNVVIETAARCPQRIGAVAGVDGGAIRLRDVYPAWRRCAEELAPPHLIGTPLETMERRLRATHPDWPDSGIEGTLANFEVRRDGTVAPWLTRERHMRILRSLWEHDPMATCPRLAMPSLLILAGDRRHAPLEAQAERWFTEAVERLPAGELIHLPDADHDVHAQHPERTANLLRRLARRMRAAQEGT